MFNTILMIMMFLLLSFILLLMNFLISKKSYLNREKMSPFECGFDPMTMSRTPFSMHFFMISLIFLIFDIEITLLIPIIMMLFKLNKIMLISMTMFIIILLLGLYIEYMEQSIDWKI